jgi:hypothetical protein
MYFDAQEALRYFGAFDNSKQALATVQTAYADLQDKLQPRYTAVQFSCTVDADRVALNIKGSAPERAVFHSKNLARHLQGCQELYLFAATLGVQVDVALRRLTLSSAALGAAGQAVAAALIETYCDDCCRELEAKLPPGYQLKSRFSPGYGDWPLQEQKVFFPLLGCAKTIGLTLTDGCMMAPIKSVTAVIGIGKGTGSVYAQKDQHDCKNCASTTCEFRR